MAKLTFCQGILKIEGRLSGVTVRELSDEEIERRESGTRSERVHPVHQEQRERFRQAAAYAVAALADPELRAVYKKGCPETVNPLQHGNVRLFEGEGLAMKRIGRLRKVP